MKPLTERPALDAHDFATVRQMYGEAQQWARHYENAVISANVVIVSASLVLYGLLFESVSEPISTSSSWKNVTLGATPVALVLVGFSLTSALFGMYKVTVQRMIRLENLLNCYDAERYAIDGQGSLLPFELTTIAKPVSVKFFQSLYVLLLMAYLGLWLLPLM